MPTRTPRSLLSAAQKLELHAEQVVRARIEAQM
jgi:hypothetical protein